MNTSYQRADQAIKCGSPHAGFNKRGHVGAFGADVGRQSQVFACAHRPLRPKNCPDFCRCRVRRDTHHRARWEPVKTPRGLDRIRNGWQEIMRASSTGCSDFQPQLFSHRGHRGASWSKTLRADVDVSSAHHHRCDLAAHIASRLNKQGRLACFDGFPGGNKSSNSATDHDRVPVIAGQFACR